MSTPPAPPIIKHRTAWHPLFVTVLRQLLPAADFDVIAELLLNQQPQRIDTVVVRKTHPTPALRSTKLRALTMRLAAFTLIEFKGPRDVLEAEDLLCLLGYAYQYRSQNRLLQRAELCLMIVANRMSGPFRDLVEAEGGQIAQEEPGIYAIQGLVHPLYLFESEGVGDHVLSFFSRLFVSKPGRLFSLLDEEERAIFRAVYNEVKQFARDQTVPLRYGDFEELAMSLEELMNEMINDMPKEKLLAHLTMEERLKGMGPEERLKGMGPEELLKGLSSLSPPERERLKKLL